MTALENAVSRRAADLDPVLCCPLRSPPLPAVASPQWDESGFPLRRRPVQSDCPGVWQRALPGTGLAWQHRHAYAAVLHRGLPTGRPGRLWSRPAARQAVHCTPGPHPPGLSRCHGYGALPLVPLACPLIPLAGPGPSGSTRPSRLCQRCFRPSWRLPRPDCAQLLPGCCDNPARRSHTSFDSQRLTAHQRLVAQRNECQSQNSDVVVRLEFLTLHAYFAGHYRASKPACPVQICRLLR